MSKTPVPLPLAKASSFILSHIESAVGLPDGTILLDQKSVFSILDPRSSNVSIPTLPLQIAPDHVIAALPDGRVILVSGANDSVKNSADTLIFNPTKLAWTPGPKLNEGRIRPGVFVDSKENVWVAGGYVETESRDPSDASVPLRETLQSVEMLEAGGTAWKVMSPLQEARASPMMLSLPNGRMVAAGGLVLGKSKGSEKIGDRFLDTAEVYDTGNGQWSTVGKLFPHLGWVSYQNIRPLGTDQVLVTEKTETAVWNLSGVIAKRIAKSETTVGGTTWVPNPEGTVFGIGNMSRFVTLWYPEQNLKNVSGMLDYGRSDAQAFVADGNRLVVFGGYGRDSWHAFTYLGGWGVIAVVLFGFFYRAYWGHRAAGMAYTQGVMLGSGLIIGFFIFFFHFISGVFHMSLGVRG